MPGEIARWLSTSAVERQRSRELDAIDHRADLADAHTGRGGRRRAVHPGRDRAAACGSAAREAERRITEIGRHAQAVILGEALRRAQSRPGAARTDGGPPNGEPSGPWPD